jgi:hypothetical protein
LNSFQIVQILFLPTPFSLPLFSPTPLLAQQATGRFSLFPHHGPTPPAAAQLGLSAHTIAASPLRLLPCPQLMTVGDHLSSPSPRPCPGRTKGRVRPATARRLLCLARRPRRPPLAYLSSAAPPGPHIRTLAASFCRARAATGTLARRRRCYSVVEVPLRSCARR